MSDQPTVRLLSCTAYPLETLYVAAVSLDDPEVHFQKPEEIRMLLYTELNKHLRTDLKEFILNKMRELVSDSSDSITDIVKFVFMLDGVSQELYTELKTLERGNTHNQRVFTGWPTKFIWNSSLGELHWALKAEHPYGLIHKVAVDACETLLEVDPYLHQLLTEK